MVHRFSKRCPNCTIHSCKQHLSQLAIQIFNLCFVSHVELQMQWLPRTANQKADYLSRIVDPDDWALGRKYFQILNAHWGPFSIDRLPQTTVVTWLVLTLVFGVPEQNQSMLFHKIGLRTIIACDRRYFLFRVQFQSDVIAMHGARLLFLNGHPLLFGLSLVLASVYSLPLFVQSSIFHLVRIYFSLVEVS